MKNIRSCLDFISSLVERTFCADLHSRNAANSGLFARTERVKMPKRTSNKPKSSFINLLTVKSKQLLIPYLLLVPLFALASCKSGVDEASMSPQEELEHAVQLHRDKDYDNAMRSYSRVVLHPDATDNHRAVAFYNMSAIECDNRTDYSQAIKYISQSIALSAPKQRALLYACKGDYSMRYGVLDSAVHYCNKALYDSYDDSTVGYVAHYVLWQCYERIDMPDSAACHERLYNAIRAGEAYQPIAMNEMTDELNENIIKVDKHEKRTRLTMTLTILGAVLFSAGLLWLVVKLTQRKRQKSENNVSRGEVQPSGKNTQEVLSLDILQRSVHTFEATPMYEELSNLRIKEKELYKSTFTKNEQLEDCLFSSFKEITYLLGKEYNLSSSELLTLYCTYMGFSPNVIGYITHTTAGSVRKRNDRLKIKLLPEHADIFFGRGEKTE